MLSTTYSYDVYNNFTQLFPSDRYLCTPRESPDNCFVTRSHKKMNLHMTCLKTILIVTSHWKLQMLITWKSTCCLIVDWLAVFCNTNCHGDSTMVSIKVSNVRVTTWIHSIVIYSDMWCSSSYNGSWVEIPNEGHLRIIMGWIKNT